MKTRDIHTIFDDSIRCKPFTSNPDWHFEWADNVYRVSGPDDNAFSNTVLFQKPLSPESVEATVDAHIEHFKRLGHSFEWKVYSYDKPSNLSDILAAKGFRKDEVSTLVLRDLEQYPGHPVDLKDAEIIELGDIEEFNRLPDVLDEVWGDPEHSKWLISMLGEEKRQDGDALRVFSVKTGGKEVSHGWYRLHPGGQIASFWGGTTLPAYRGKGYYSALVEHRAALVGASGYSAIYIECSPLSLEIVTKMGFSKLAGVSGWVWDYKKQG